MMKKVYLLAVICACVSFVSCGNSTATAAKGGSSKAAVEQVKSNFKFLTDMGIDAKKYVMPDFYEQTYEEEPLGLNLDQQVKLQFITAEEAKINDMPCGLSLCGVRALPGDFTLVAYNVEYGDGSSALLMVYDKKGRCTDKLLVGSWGLMTPFELSEDMTEGVLDSWKTTLQFNSPSAFDITKIRHMYNAKAKSPVNDGLPDYENVGDVWKVVTVMKCEVDNKGHILVNDNDMKVTGHPDDRDRAFIEADNFFGVPQSDKGLLDRLNVRADKADIKNQDLEGDLRVAYIYGVFDYYGQNHAEMLQWLYDNRNNNKWGYLLEDVIGKSMISKEQLIKDIDALPDAAARNYLHQLTAQWGDYDAVG